MRADGSPVHLVIMGVSGSGKTTVAKEIHKQTHFPYAEADDFHPQENKDKMAAGIPLNDQDRQPWLESLRDWMTFQAHGGFSTVITCSALRRKYRDTLSEADGDVIFVHLTGSEPDITARMNKRKDHFMPPSLVPSQFATLEKIGSGENGIELDMNQPTTDLVEQALAIGTATQKMRDR